MAEKVSIIVKGMTGETVLGPDTLETCMTIAALCNSVGEKLGQPPEALAILHGQELCEKKNTLSASGVVGDTCLTVVVGDQLLEAQRTLNELLQKKPESKDFILRWHDEAKPREPWACGEELDFDEAWTGGKKKELVEEMGLTDLPGELDAWVTVLCLGGKRIENKRKPACNSSCSTHPLFECSPCGLTGKQGGLLYFSSEGWNDNMLTYFVDAFGEMAAAFPNQNAAAGAVWFANTWDDICEVAAGGTPSVEQWRQVMPVGSAPTVNMDCAPKVVAPTLTAFFRQWIETGLLPRGCSFVSECVRHGE